MNDHSPIEAGLPAAPRPAMAYNDLIRDVSASLEAALRANAHTGRRVYVRYWPAITMRPGLLFVEVEGEAMPADPYASHRWPNNIPGPRIVRPASGTWESMAYSHLYSNLWHRFRSESILGPGDTV
jgi:hypothetical protein